jgi:2-keto-3-deoxy-L-rhamnonate aldolase RhmA
MSISAFSLARRLRAGETVYSGWCGLPYPIVAELVGREGFAAVTLDGQHGLWDTASIVAGVAHVRQSGAAPIVRIPVGEFASVSRALDFGAEGVIAPMINTAADARAYVSFAKFFLDPLISPLRSATATTSIRWPRKSTARSSASSPPQARQEKSWAPIVIAPSAPWRLPSAAFASWQLAAT